jgi:flagellar basal-body rod protein FlgB
VENDLAILALKALDGLSTRAVATAQNIANASTANYRPLKVSFEDALANAAANGSDAIAAVTPQVTTAKSGPDSELRLDLELATASGTAGRYSALVELLSRQLQLQALAITGNS